jgi:hypothetical protein
MEKKKSLNERSSYAFAGFLFLGIAFGLLFNQIAVGALMGLALGCISIALLSKNK